MYTYVLADKFNKDKGARVVVARMEVVVGSRVGWDRGRGGMGERGGVIGGREDRGDGDPGTDAYVVVCWGEE